MSKLLGNQPRLVAALLAGTILSGSALLSAHAADIAGAVNPPAAAAHMPDFADLVAQVKPAVVSITVKIDAPAEDGDPRMGMMPGMTPDPHGHRRHGEARGSGFLTDATGTVVTNNHVVKDAKSVTVTLDDGTEYTAKVIGRDARTDLAVLKVQSADRKFPFIQLGDSAAVRPGEWVVAMGNPFGLGGTVTAGIVSAKGRDIGSGPYDQFIQIDAPINQGNSGGPLFTQDGRVVGVNSAILSPSGGSIGIGFAIPANVVKSVISELEATGHVTRGFAGLETQPIGPGMAKALRLNAADGALVAGVQPEGPAAKAGVEPGDVIRAVDGHAIKTPRDLAMSIGAAKPGETVKLDMIRDGVDRTVKLALIELPNERQTADAADTADNKGKIGIALAPLSPELRDRLDLPKGTKGAVIAGVEPGSPAAEAGIREGDLVVGVGSQPVATPEEAVKAIRSNGRAKTLALRILREGRPAFIAIDPAPTDKG